MKKVLKWVGIVIAAILAIVVIFVAVLSICEFKPDDEEDVEITGQASQKISEGDSMTIMSWNIGYGGLSDNADFFMDGGEDVSSCSKEEVEANMQGIIDTINEINPDTLLIQECDTNSKRSKYVNEYETLQAGLSGYESSMAYNYKCLYVPYPIPTIGKVNCGIVTFSSYDTTSATRISLPCPFSWPMRLANLKRCLMLDRIPIEGTDKELVLCNLHLEAYDDGEGKVAQTKQLIQVLQDEVDAGNYVIAGGDFNQTFSNVDMTNFPILGDNWEASKIDVDDFGDDFTLIMDDSTPSCRLDDQPYAGADPETVQYYVIDGFIVSNNITIDDMHTISEEFKYSDHNPIVMDVTLNPEN